MGVKEHWRRWACLGTAGVCAWVAGCGPTGRAGDSGSGPEADPKASASEAAVSGPATPPDPRLHQSFAEATLSEPPANALQPPDTTMTGKSVGKLYTQVVGQWDGIRFQTPEGRRLTYTAVVDTEMGNIEIALRPDWAPNHVRSFVALARSGYFDGLVFERTTNEHDARDGSRIEMIEGGCPLGTGDFGYGSIGYWLKPEITAKEVVVHDEGTVGAWGDGDGGACRFYVTLCPAPSLDERNTIFGKVVRGVDVAHKILALPLRNDAPEGNVPLRPVVIRRVTVQCVEDSGAKLNG